MREKNVDQSILHIVSLRVNFRAMGSGILNRYHMQASNGMKEFPEDSEECSCQAACNSDQSKVGIDASSRQNMSLME